MLYNQTTMKVFYPYIPVADYLLCVDIPCAKIVLGENSVAKSIPHNRRVKAYSTPG